MKIIYDCQLVPVIPSLAMLNNIQLLFTVVSAQLAYLLKVTLS